MSSLKRWPTPTMKQTWMSLPAVLAKMAYGMSLAFASCFLTTIKDPGSDIKMDIHTSTWFVSSLTISFVVSYFIGSFTMSRIGRRKAAMICSLPGIIGQLMIYFAGDVPTLMTGRVLTGLTGGSAILIRVVAVAESTSPKNRGMFLYIATASLNIGSLIIHAVGYHTNWRTLAILIAIPFILIFIISYTSPESPSWLAERKQYERSREAFYWLRGRTEDSTREIEELIRAQRHKKVDKTIKENVTDLVLKFKQRNFVHPVLLCLVGIILMEAGGRHIFPSYAAQLIEEIMSGGFNTYYYNIVLDILIILSGISASYMIRVMKMRTLLFSTGAATVAVLFLACLSLYLVKNGVISETYSMLSLILFALFIMVSNTGCTCIPLALLGELFPLEHRAVASVTCNAFSATLTTIFLKIMPYMVAAFYIYGAFAVLCCVIVVVLVVLYFTLPETKDKTLQEIEEYFTHGQFRDGVPVPTEEKDLDTFKISNDNC